MAWIERRSGNWSVAWRHAGQRQRVTVGTEELAEKAKGIAEAHGHNITKTAVEIALGLVDPAEETVPAEDVLTVREWSKTWIESRTRPGPGQRRRYQSQLDSDILPVIGDMAVVAVGGSDVVRVLKRLEGRGLTPATRTRYFATMSSMFRYAELEGVISSNPCKRTDFVRDQMASDDPDEDDHVYLTPAEYGLIWRAMRPAGRPVIDVLIGTGARFGEATALKVENFVDGDSPALRVHWAWKQDDRHRWYLGPTKGKVKRTVDIAEQTAEVVRPLLVDANGKRRPDSALILVGRDGGRVDGGNFRQRYWLPAVEEASRCDAHLPEAAADGGPARTDTGRWRPGAVSTCDCPGRLHVEPRLHDLRHTFVAWMIDEGIPIKAIATLIGHRSTTMTETVYGGILPKTTQGAGRALGRKLGEALG